MAFIAINDLFKFTIVAVQGNQVSMTSAALKCTAITGTGGTDLQCVQALDTALHTAFKAIMNNNAQYRGVMGRFIAKIPTPAAVSSAAHVGNGSSGATAMPWQTCGLLQTRTDFAGPQYRGRAYLPFPSTSSTTTQGQPTTSYIALLNALGVIMYGSFNAGSGGNTSNMEPVIFSQRYGIATVIQEVTVSGSWATQRKRGDFGRPNVSPI